MKIWINRAGQNLGTFTLEEIQRGLNQGLYVPTDLGWQEGMESWKPLSEFAGLEMPREAQPAPLAPISPPSPYNPPPLQEESLAIVLGSEDGPAWERRKELGLVKALALTWKEILFSPAVSFARMKTSGGYMAPFLFNLTMVVIYAFFTTIYQLIITGVVAATTGSMRNNGSDSFSSISAGLPPLINVGIMVVSIPLILGLTFLNAGITHLCLSLFKGTSKGYEATYRVIAYSYSSWVFVLVPCAGGFVSSIWWLVATIIGLSKVHRTEGWRAAVAVFLPIFVCVGIVVVFYVAIIAVLVGSHPHANA